MNSHYNIDKDPIGRIACEISPDLEICRSTFEIGLDLKNIRIENYSNCCFARICNGLGCNLEGNAIFLNFTTYFDLFVYDLNEYVLFF